MIDQVTTPTTRTDAVLRIAEDVIVVGGTAITTWLTSHNPETVAIAAAGSPIVRSGIAQVLSNRRVSGVLAALKLVYAALGSTSSLASQPVVASVSATGGGGGVNSTSTAPHSTAGASATKTASATSDGPDASAETQPPSTETPAAADETAAATEPTDEDDELGEPYYPGDAAATPTEAPA